MDLLDPRLRRVVRTSEPEFRPYDRYGTPSPDLDWIPLSGDAGEGYECFIVRFKPGTSSTAHEHTGGEEFYVLEGELVDCDGTVFRPGDFVIYEPGSKHFSTAVQGCTLLAILRGQNRRLAHDDPDQDLTRSLSGS